MVQYGEAGKPMCDVTYHEYYMFSWVSPSIIAIAVPFNASMVTLLHSVVQCAKLLFFAADGII
jgi:hypothetical protein